MEEEKDKGAECCCDDGCGSCPVHDKDEKSCNCDGSADCGPGCCCKK